MFCVDRTTGLGPVPDSAVPLLLSLLSLPSKLLDFPFWVRASLALTALKEVKGMLLATSKLLSDRLSRTAWARLCCLKSSRYRGEISPWCRMRLLDSGDSDLSKLSLGGNSCEDGNPAPGLAVAGRKSHWSWWWKSISSSNWMPQNSHGMIMLPSVCTACCCCGYVDLLLCSWSKKSLTCLLYSSCWLGDEPLLLNEAKALAGLQPVCYMGNVGKKELVILTKPSCTK